MSNISDQIYSLYERLASAKLNELINQINSHNHGSAGGVPIEAAEIQIENNTFLTAVDAAGTGTVDLIKASALDIATLAAGVVVDGILDPASDYAVATKIYVDTQVAGVSKTTFGAWDVGAPYIKDTAYGPATTDGFVVGYGSWSNSGNIKGLTDGNVTPTTQRTFDQTNSAGDSHAGSAVFPVRSGDYWMITGFCQTIYWIPLS